MSERKNKRGLHLADLKKHEAEQTAAKLMRALDRFEFGGLKRVPVGSKLTRLNLAKEADVAKDTPFSHYRQPHPKAGAYRFPDIVERFKRLRKQDKPEPTPEPDEVAKLKATIVDLQTALSASRIVVNALDAQNVDLKRHGAELEELVSAIGEENENLKSEVIKLKRQSLRGIPTVNSGVKL
jgi:hypothetical protein